MKIVFFWTFIVLETYFVSPIKNRTDLFKVNLDFFYNFQLYYTIKSPTLREQYSNNRSISWEFAKNNTIYSRLGSLDNFILSKARESRSLYTKTPEALLLKALSTFTSKLQFPLLTNAIHGVPETGKVHQLITNGKLLFMV